MTDEHWAVYVLDDIYAALPTKKHWVARQHLIDAMQAIRTVHELEQRAQAESQTADHGSKADQAPV